MNKDYKIPKKLKNYLKRLATEYKNSNLSELSDVITNSKFTISETGYDFNFGCDGHSVVLLVPDSLMGNIPLDEQHEIQQKLVWDLNRASSAISDECISEVHFEYLDEDHLEEKASPEIELQAIERLWQPNMLKLFISHRDTYKKQAHELATALEKYGISSFVAHDSIEPDEDWQQEIEKALKSMDAMLAFITDDFFGSAWTNQEIGYALAKGVPIISLKLQSSDPVGFIKNRQAIRGSINSIENAATPILDTIKRRMLHSPAYRKSVLYSFMNAYSFINAERTFKQVSGLGKLSADEVEQIVKTFNNNSQLHDCYALIRNSNFIDFINKYSSTKLILSNGRIKPQKTEAEIPF